MVDVNDCCMVVMVTFTSPAAQHIPKIYFHINYCHIKKY